MDTDERRSDQTITLDRDAQINVVVNRPEGGDTTLDLGHVLRNMRLRRRVYIWVIVLFVALGVCAGLLMHQFSQKPLTVSSVVTLDYEVPNPLLDPLKNPAYDPSLLLDESIPQKVAVSDLTAPDGTELDVNQITSSYVLQSALSALELSHPVTLTALRDNITIEKILTEDSRRQQEVAQRMLQDKNTSAYNQVLEIQLTYDNQFVVSLSNEFSDGTGTTPYSLKSGELRRLLDAILTAYNGYLADTYADSRLPDDQISIIDTQELDALESLDRLRSAVDDLYDYCDSKSDSVRAYRSWRTGRTLEDLMKDLSLVRTMNVDYLYAYLYTNGIVRDRDSALNNYRYQLRAAESELEEVNENIAATRTILENYKNDEIYVTTQEGGDARSTLETTDYYNRMMLQQADNYAAAADLQANISDLQDKIDTLTLAVETTDTLDVDAELSRAMEVCRTAYGQIRAHVEEVTSSALFTRYSEHTVAQGEAQSITTAVKKVLIGAFAGLAIAFVLWFISALIPEMRGRKEEPVPGKEADAK